MTTDAKATYAEWLEGFKRDCRAAEVWQETLRDSIRKDVAARIADLGVSESQFRSILWMLDNRAEEISQAATPWPHGPFKKDEAGKSGSFAIDHNLRLVLRMLT